jgi:cell fate regulator YaaT (PSP1 superfamily)
MGKIVVGIRFKTAGKQYYFDPQDLVLSRGDKVVVETIRGVELGEVITPSKEVEEEEIISTLKPVLRKATESDLAQYEKNQSSIPNDLPIIQKLIEQNQLTMKLLGAEYTLDHTKLIIYFSAEGRVDFRELVKDLAREFHIRIELRQVGTRDSAKFLGGIGPCGYLLCCTTWLGEFDTISIKMAKNQNLSLNPSNISGLCGKLLCCINYENETYLEHRTMLPKIGSFVETKDDGKVPIIGVNIIEKTVRYRTQDDIIKTVHVEELVNIEQYDRETPEGSGE